MANSPSPSPRPPAPRSVSRLVLLGRFEWRKDGQAVPLPMGVQRVLAYLGLRRHPMLRSTAAGTLWPETTDEQAAARLRTMLWRANRSGCPVIEASNGSLELADSTAVDLWEVERRARRLTGGEANGDDPGLSTRDLAEDVLPGWDDEWIEPERARFRNLRLHALEALAHRFTGAGRHPEAVEAALAAVGADPLRETARRALIRAYLAEGNRAEAALEYVAFARLLYEELGVDPSDDLKGLVTSSRLVSA